jgi:hypothetical protein
VTFEIGPRENVKTYEAPAFGPYLGYKAEAHQRTINGTEYVFGRFAYDNGVVAVQAIVAGRPLQEFMEGKRPTDVHYWASGEEMGA